jgi:predicted Zn-dependent protease
MPTQGTIWRRRALLMLIVALLVAIPVTILIRGGDDEESAPPTVAAPALNPGVQSRALDVRYQVPEGWKESKKAKAIQLLSTDRSVLIAIASPALASKSGALLDDALASIRSGYRDARIQPGSGRQVGGLDAKGAVVAAKTRAGNELRIVVAVAEGKKRAYLVEVFTAVSADPERLREAQVALNSLRLEG